MMSSNKAFDLTITMESWIDSGMKEIELMRSLLTMAEEAHANSGFRNFTIGDETYTLEQLEAIQREEEHEALINAHKARRK